MTFLLLVWYPVNIHYTGLFIHGFPVSKHLRLHLYHLNGRQMQGFKRAVELRNTLLCRFNSFVNAIDAFSQPCLDAFFPYWFRLRDEWPSPGGGRATESGNNEYNQEFWYARELQEVLEYSQWRRFHEVISKAMKACESSGYEVDDHFANVGKMIKLAKGAEREVEDFMLTRYACYLIVMNGDPRKEVIALGQTYFAVKTRQQELIEDYAIFQNRGYQGLYGGLGAKEIHSRKGLKKNQQILDHMGSTELAANLFRATQTDEKLRRDNVVGKKEAGDVHYSVGQKVRQTIVELGGTMPEDLPTPEKSIKQIEREESKRIENKDSK